MDSIVAGNGSNGVVANAVAPSAQVNVMLVDSGVASNGAVGLRGDGTNAAMRISNVTITGNGTGSQFTNGAQFLSYGNNHIDGNTNNGLNPSIIPTR